MKNVDDYEKLLGVNELVDKKIDELGSDAADLKA